MRYDTLKVYGSVNLQATREIEVALSSAFSNCHVAASKRPGLYGEKDGSHPIIN